MQTKTGTAFEQIVKNRRSIRGFLPMPIPHHLLVKVFELAQWAPSNCNTQPWQVYVASGIKLQCLEEKIKEANQLGKSSLDFDYDGKYPGIYKDRQVDAATQLYAAMGIDREDKEKRKKAFLNNFSFFGAPHVAFIFLPEFFGIREAADVGMYAQNLMLSLSAYGFGSCPQTSLSFYADIVREVLEVPSSNKLLFGISFGEEDKSHAANLCRVSRAALSESIHFIYE
ncbi:nitroreductase [bacterium AH-315-K03]|nr:nitroreductase [bacterium AH-315-K03]